VTINRRIAQSLLFLATTLVSATMWSQFPTTSATGPLRNLSTLKPPPGADVAIVVFEDLGCPACANAHPIELKVAAAEHVPVLRYDFPFKEHVWTYQGAVDARYIQEHLSPKLADQYRSDVFAAQRSIANKDDLQRFTELWLQRHGQQMPFVIDPNQALSRAVQSDFDLGRHINVSFTPTIVVVTKNAQQVVCGTGDRNNDNPDNLLPVVESAIAQCKKAASHRNARM
jgi:protein-disulfide isomerase